MGTLFLLLLLHRINIARMMQPVREDSMLIKHGVLVIWHRHLYNGLVKITENVITTELIIQDGSRTNSIPKWSLRRTNFNGLFTNKRIYRLSNDKWTRNLYIITNINRKVMVKFAGMTIPFGLIVDHIRTDWMHRNENHTFVRSHTAKH